MYSSPLSDCTESVIQAFNKTNNTVKAKPVTKIRHDPYSCCLLAPEDSIHSSLSPYSTESRMAGCTPDSMMSFYINQTPYSGLSTPFIKSNTNGGPFTSNHPQEEEGLSTGSVSRSLFHTEHLFGNTSKSPHDGSNSAKLQSSSSSMPSKNIGKIYVGGRPRPVLCRHCVEVTVTLRCGEAVFIIADVYETFPSDIEIKDLVGLYVIVEGDRGEDMGVISSVKANKTITTDASDRTPDKERSTNICENDSKNEKKTNLPRVLRHANDLDIMRYEQLPQAEEEALARCQECLEKADLKVPITIERVIFQYDRKKLTVQFKSDAYVDFNILTRMLHTHYKCRIWMHQLNRNIQANSNGTKSHWEGRHSEAKKSNRSKNSNSENRRRE